VPRCTITIQNQFQPYNHSNIDSDEVLYYVDGDFMSRNNIEQGHITLHPKGIPHGPAPGAMERSIGHKPRVSRNG
jgi:homogentisate 1,2-dioxygenase